MTELQEEEVPTVVFDEEEKNNILNNLDPRIKTEKGNNLWALCFDETIDWNAHSYKNLDTYHPMFKYDGPLYCLTLLHQVLFRERQLVRQEGEYTEYDEQLFQLGKLGRMYRTNINK
jgi:hypothetical protein